MTSCRNCGHESHCGQMLVKALDAVGEEIEICRQCICELCDENTVSKSKG